MKIIDLLNKIANGEEVPLEIKCCNKKYRYDSLSTDYEQIGGFNSLFKDLLILKYGFDLPKCLNDEVEILEEEKKDNFTGWKLYQDGKEVCLMDCSVEEKKIPEKLNITYEKNCKNNYKWKCKGYNISTPQKLIADKVNEIIDYLKSKGDE